jgi:hypothetical protein
MTHNTRSGPTTCRSSPRAWPRCGAPRRVGPGRLGPRRRRPPDVYAAPGRVGRPGHQGLGPGHRCVTRGQWPGADLPSAARGRAQTRAAANVLEAAQQTYVDRGAPLDGADQALIGTSEHGVLGRRWVYDGTHDPVLVAQLLALLQGHAEPQAHAKLRRTLRSRLSEAIAGTDLLPVWFVTAFGPLPPARKADEWMDAATDLLAYRMTYQVTDKVVALGEPSSGSAAPHRRSWHQDLTQELKRWA